MRSMLRQLLALVSLAVVAAPSTAQAPASAAATGPVKALVGGRLIDGYGGAPLLDSVVLIEGEKIVAVGRQGQVAIPAGAEVISTEGMDVLPGLWDCHVHLMIVGHGDYDHWDKTYPPLFRSTIMPAAAKQLLLAGVTSARELGAPLDDVLAIRDAINQGKIPGPTLYVSGPFIQHEPYPGTEAFRWGVKGAADARAKVKRLADAGVDLIKLIDQDQMTMDEVQGGRRRGARARAAGDRPRPPPRGDPPRHRRRRRQLRAHRARHRPRVSRRPHGAAARARRRAGRDAALLDADGGAAAALRPDARQPRAPRRPALARGAAAGGGRRHPAVPGARRPPRVLPERTAARAQRAAQVRAAARSRRDAARRHRQRRAAHLPQRLHLARDRRLGAHLRRAGDGRHPRRHLLAGEGDEGRQGGGHRRAKASTPTSSPCAATCCCRPTCSPTWRW